MSEDQPGRDHARTPRSRHRLLLGLGLAIAVLIGLAGAGSWVVSQPGTVQIGPGGNAADPDALDRFVTCVREEHDIDISDPDPDRPTVVLPEGLDPHGEQWQAAWDGCGELLSGSRVRFEAPGSDGQRGVQR